MKNEIKQIFEPIHAEEELKQKTVRFLAKEMEKRSKKRLNKIYSTASVLFLLLLALGGFYQVYYTGEVYIDIDINPSFELKVNRFHKVIGVSAYNEDGDEVLKQVDINNKVYMDAVKQLFQAMGDEGFLKEGELLSVTIQSSDKNREEKVIEELKRLLSDVTKTEGIQADVFTVSEEVRKHAHKNHLSTAKYLAILELQEVNPAITMEECRNHSVGEIKQWFRECCHEMEGKSGHHGEGHHR